MWNASSLAQAAGADDAEHRRGADVVLPAVERVAISCGSTCGRSRRGTRGTRRRPRRAARTPGRAARSRSPRRTGGRARPWCAAPAPACRRKGPSPAEISSSAAHTSSGIERSALSSSRVGARASGRRRGRVAGGGQRQQRPPPRRQHGAHADIARVSSVAPPPCREGLRQVGREELGHEAAHARAAPRRKERAPVQIERPEAGDHERAMPSDEPAGQAARVEQRRRQAVDLVRAARLGSGPSHPSALRSQALARSASATSAMNTSSIVRPRRR